MGNAAIDISAILKQAASETLEKLAFTEVYPREDPHLQDSCDGFHGSRIELGTLGTMDLIIRKGLLEDIAGVLFNASGDGINGELLKDTHLEILNIIAGRFLEGIFRDNSDFVMGLPKMHLDIAEWNALPVRWVMVGDDGKELAVGLKPTASPV